MIASRQKSFDRKSMPEYPFDIGYRWVKHGSVDVQVPLTEEDFLHPQEEDRFLLTDAHTVAIEYVKHALKWDRKEETFRVFSDHRVDFQVAEIEPMGPDVIVLGEFAAEWNPRVGTLPIDELGVEMLLVAEMTSQSTRYVDLEEKPDLYFRCGVPYYLIFDLHAGPRRDRSELLAFRASRKGFVRMKETPDNGVWVPTVGLWFKFEDDRVVAHTAEKVRIPEQDQVNAQLLAEKQRADAAEKELAELRARVANPPAKKNGHQK